MSQIQVAAKSLEAILESNAISVQAPSEKVRLDTSGKGYFPRVQLDHCNPVVTAFSIPSALVSAVLPDNKVALLFQDVAIFQKLQDLSEKLADQVRSFYPEHRVYWTNNVTTYKKHKDNHLSFDGLAGKEISDLVVRVGIVVTPTVEKDACPGGPIAIVFARTFYQLLGWSTGGSTVTPASSGMPGEHPRALSQPPPVHLPPPVTIPSSGHPSTSGTPSSKREPNWPERSAGGSKRSGIPGPPRQNHPHQQMVID